MRVGSSEKSGEREGTREERRLRIRLTCHHPPPPNPRRIPTSQAKNFRTPSRLPGPPELLLELMSSLLQEGGKQKPKKGPEHQAAVWTRAGLGGHICPKPDQEAESARDWTRQQEVS